MPLLRHHCPATTVGDRVVLRAVGTLLRPSVRGLRIDPAVGLIVDPTGYSAADLHAAGIALLALQRLDVGDVKRDGYLQHVIQVQPLVDALVAAVDGATAPRRMFIDRPAPDRARQPEGVLA